MLTTAIFIMTIDHILKTRTHCTTPIVIIGKRPPVEYDCRREIYRLNGKTEYLEQNNEFDNHTSTKLYIYL